MPEERRYDVIGYGDEVPGVLATVAAAREFRRQTGRYPSVLLMAKGDAISGLGGHLVRGRLAYLDRSQIAPAVRGRLGLPTFGDPPALYAEFLRAAGVDTIALDPARAHTALQELRRRAGVDLLTGVNIESVRRRGPALEAITLRRGETYSGRQFIDATVNAELARAAGADWRSGFSSLGLPESELSVTLVFETRGLSPARLAQIEAAYLRRFTDPADSEARGWLLTAAGGDESLAARLRAAMLEPSGQTRRLYEGGDYIDVRSPALSVAYHAFRGRPFSLEQAGSLLDQANIAKLPGDRLLWNALLFDVDAEEADALAANTARPSAEMLEEMNFVQDWFLSLGSTEVLAAPELYIRHAGNVSRAVAPLSGTRMLEGGTAAAGGLATFGYHFDIRGGIRGLGERAASLGLPDPRFARPLFNVGIEHALLTDVPNLAVVSPASGFIGFAASAGRIVEHNVGVGVGVGIAAVLALQSGRQLAEVSSAEVRAVLDRTGTRPRIYGSSDPVEVARLASFETALVGSDDGIRIA